jgi:outer membrane protein TolC
MKNTGLRQSAGIVRSAWSPRRLLWGLWLAGLPWFGMGCAHESGTNDDPRGGVVATPPPLLGSAVDHRAALPGTGTTPASAIVRVSARTTDTLPPVLPQAAKELPISLDTVLRLAEDQNPQLAIGREKLCQTQLERQLVDKAWLPDVYVGTAYQRHEGGIQNFDGTLVQSSYGSLFAGVEIHSELDLREATYKKVNAERLLWQARGELSKATHEQLLETSTAYIDLLTAHEGAVTANRIGGYVEQLRASAAKAADNEPALKALAQGLEGALAAHQQAGLKLHQQAAAASAKLSYLLGLDMHTVLVPVDQQLVQLDLVPGNPPVEELVHEALQNGVGVAEMEGLLATIQQGIAQAQGPGKWMPVLEMRVLEGGFGAGPDATMDWANRFDLGLQARWNLTEFLTAKERSRLAMSRMQQVQLTYDDLKGRLTLGVREAHEASRSGLVQIQQANRAVERAAEAYKLASIRLADKNKNYAEVVQTLRALEVAEASRLQTLNDYDKAQLRLRLLLGAGYGKACEAAGPVIP